MVLTDIKEYLLVNSLQYFIGQDDIEVTDEVLVKLTERALSFYSNWRPLFIEEEVDITEYTMTLKTTTDGHRILSVQEIYYYQPILGGAESKVDWDWDYNSSNGLFRSQIQGNYTFELLIAPILADLEMQDVEFLDLLQSLYLMYVGESRKAFNLGEQPFENDGSDIYSDGKELWETTLESLQNEQQNWYLAIN